MSLQRVDHFSDDLLVDLLAVYQRMAPADRTAFNDPWFLKACWCAWQDTGPFALLLKTADGRVQGGAMFRPETVRLGRTRRESLVPLVHGASDFTAMLVIPEARGKLADELLEYLTATGETVLLPHMRPHDAVMLPETDRRFFAYSTEVNPVCVDDGSGYRKIIRKKSLVRHANWFKRNGELTVTHTQRGVPPGTIDRFADMHRARWAAKGIDSKFSNPVMVDLYRRFCAGYADTADPTSTAVFTEVTFDGHAIAMHVGFRWADTFLYQVPAVDPKMMEHSPGEVLLRSLFEYAAAEGLGCVDLGYGDETYKQRFATETRTYTTYVLAGSAISAVAIRLRRRMGTLIRKLRRY